MAEIPSVILDYRKGDHFLTLDMQSPGGLDSGEPDQVEVYEGIELEYSHLDSIFVSVDYTPRRRRRNCRRRKLNIGYGLPEGSEKEETGFPSSAGRTAAAPTPSPGLPSPAWWTTPGVWSTLWRSCSPSACA